MISFENGYLYYIYLYSFSCISFCLDCICWSRVTLVCISQSFHNIYILIIANVTSIRNKSTQSDEPRTSACVCVKISDCARPPQISTAVTSCPFVFRLSMMSRLPYCDMRRKTSLLFYNSLYRAEQNNTNITKFN